MHLIEQIYSDIFGKKKKKEHNDITYSCTFAGEKSPGNLVQLNKWINGILNVYSSNMEYYTSSIYCYNVYSSFVLRHNTKDDVSCTQMYSFKQNII